MRGRSAISHPEGRLITCAQPSFLQALGTEIFPAPDRISYGGKRCQLDRQQRVFLGLQT